jgi:hypothetical protein
MPVPLGLSGVASHSSSTKVLLPRYCEKLPIQLFTPSFSLVPNDSEKP